MYRGGWIEGGEVTTASVHASDTFTDLDDVVLFDVTREAGNELIGVLLSLRSRAEACGDIVEAARWDAECRDVTAQVNSVWGRESLLLRLRQWGARTAELRS